MSTVTVFVEPDPFVKAGATVKSYVPTWEWGDPEKLKSLDSLVDKDVLRSVREVSRPLMGITAKPNTHAFLQVIGADGKPIKVLNQIGTVGGTLNDLSGSPTVLDEAVKKVGGVDPRSGWLSKEDKGREPTSYAWTDWILLSVQEERAEKTQIVETFGRSYLYAFGERPRVLAFSGMLMNTVDYNWRAVFWENWDKYFRATKLLEQNARIYISWDDILVEGYPLNAAAVEVADNPNAMMFQFGFFVTNYTNLSALASWKASKAETIAVSRAGYTTPEASLTSNRFSIVEWLGNATATKASSFVWDQLYGKANALPPGAGRDAALTNLRLLSRSAGRLVNFAEQSVLTALSGQFFSSGLLQASLAGFTQDVLSTEINLGARLVENAAGLKIGEVNAWFGFTSTILDRITVGGWDVDQQGNVTQSVTNVLRLGSIDRIIQAMGYATISSFSSTKNPYASSGEQAMAVVRAKTFHTYYVE